MELKTIDDKGVTGTIKGSVPGSKGGDLLVHPAAKARVKKVVAAPAKGGKK